MSARLLRNMPESLTGIAIIVGTLTIFRFWAASNLGLVPDEAYYWLWSRVPSAGYFDHPPMIAWWIWLTTRIFGDTIIGIRALPVLSIFITTFAVYGIVLELEFDRKMAAVAALWLNAMFLIGGDAIIATPDAPSIMFWALSIWALARLRRTGRPWLWILVGVLAGLGCVSKYTNLFLGIGIVLWLLLDPKARRWIFSVWPYLGGATAFVIFLPVIWWNADHHWVSFAKQFGRIEDTRIAGRYFGEFVLSQFALTNPVVAVFAATEIGRKWKSLQKGEFSSLSFLVALSIPLVLYMCFHATHDRVQGNWPGPVYPEIAIIAASAAIAPNNSHHFKRLARFVIPVGIGLLVLAVIFVISPVGKHLPIRTPIDRVVGWKELYNTIDGYRKKYDAQWIATADYGLTGELAFYSGNPKMVEEIIDRARYSFEPPRQSLAHEPAILVLRQRDKGIHAFSGCFENIQQIAQVNRIAGKRIIERYYLFEISGAPMDLMERGCQAH